MHNGFGIFYICTTGKSIESIIVKSRRAWLASALSVVVNAQADARRRASEEQGACIQAGDQHRPPQPNPPRAKPLFILTIPSVFWATTLSPFFKAYFYQEPDLTNSLLTLCGYGCLVRFKKENPASVAGLRDMGGMYCWSNPRLICS